MLNSSAIASVLLIKPFAVLIQFGKLDLGFCGVKQYSSRSRPSYYSVRSQKVNESLVKLKMATFARELQYEHSRQNEIMQEALRKAERARDEAERALKGVQDSIKQDALRREKDYEV